MIFHHQRFNVLWVLALPLSKRDRHSPPLTIIIERADHFKASFADLPAAWRVGRSPPGLRTAVDATSKAMTTDAQNGWRRLRRATGGFRAPGFALATHDLESAAGERSEAKAAPIKP